MALSLFLLGVSGGREAAGLLRRDAGALRARGEAAVVTRLTLPPAGNGRPPHAGAPAQQ